MINKSSDSLQYLINTVSGSVNINAPEIAAGHFPKDNTKTVVYFKGMSSVVLAFQLQKKLKAVKIWPAPINESRRNHYHIIENWLQDVALDYFAGLTYLEGALTMKDCLHDVLLMDWIGRQNVKEYIIANIDQKELLDELAEKICTLHRNLNDAGIAHGHLHTGNIYIDANNELKLVGYDVIYIEDLTEIQAQEQSYPDYCHPAHITSQKINARADYFSALLLYLGTKAIACNAVLWGRYKVGFQENFLFSAADFLDLKNSPVYRDLKKIKSPEIDELLEILLMYCEEKDPDNLKPFYTYLNNNVQAGVSTLAVIEETNESDHLVAEDDAAETIQTRVHVTMPAQTAVANIEEIWESDEHLPGEEKSFPENILVPNLVDQKLPQEALLVEVDNNQNNKEVIHSNRLEKDPLIVTIEKKIAVVEIKSYSKKEIPQVVKKSHKSLFAMAVLFIGVFIFTTIYFLGNNAGNTGEVIAPPETTTTTTQEDAPTTLAGTKVNHDTSTNISTLDSALANTLPTEDTANLIPVTDSLGADQKAATDPLAKTAATEANNSADSSVAGAGKQLSINDSATGIEDSKNIGHKRAVVKSGASKKQPANSFEIGAVPKQ